MTSVLPKKKWDSESSYSEYSEGRLKYTESIDYKLDSGFWFCSTFVARGYMKCVFSSGFVELGLLDQVHLLECCWLEVLMVGLIWRSVDHPGKLIFSPDLSLSRYHRQILPSFTTLRHFTSLIKVTVASITVDVSLNVTCIVNYTVEGCQYIYIL